jgi:hypothetical protein
VSHTVLCQEITSSFQRSPHNTTLCPSLSVLSLSLPLFSHLFFAASWSSCRCRWHYMRRIVKSCWIGCGRNWKPPAETPPTVSSFCRFFQFFLPLRLLVLRPCLLALPCLAFPFFRASCLPEIDVELSGPTLLWGSNTKTRS